MRMTWDQALRHIRYFRRRRDILLRAVYVDAISWDVFYYGNSAYESGGLIVDATGTYFKFMNVRVYKAVI